MTKDLKLWYLKYKTGELRLYLTCFIILIILLPIIVFIEYNIIIRNLLTSEFSLLANRVNNIIDQYQKEEDILKSLRKEKIFQKSSFSYLSIYDIGEFDLIWSVGKRTEYYDIKKMLNKGLPKKNRLIPSLISSELLYIDILKNINNGTIEAFFVGEVKKPFFLEMALFVGFSFLLVIVAFILYILSLRKIINKSYYELKNSINNFILLFKSINWTEENPILEIDIHYSFIKDLYSVINKTIQNIKEKIISEFNNIISEKNHEIEKLKTEKEQSKSSDIDQTQELKKEEEEKPELEEAYKRIQELEASISTESDINIKILDKLLPVEIEDFPNLKLFSGASYNDKKRKYLYRLLDIDNEHFGFFFIDNPYSSTEDLIKVFELQSSFQSLLMVNNLSLRVLSYANNLFTIDNPSDLRFRAMVGVCNVKELTVNITTASYHLSFLYRAETKTWKRVKIDNKEIGSPDFIEDLKYAKFKVKKNDIFISLSEELYNLKILDEISDSMSSSDFNTEKIKSLIEQRIMENKILDFYYLGFIAT